MPTTSGLLSGAVRKAALTGDPLPFVLMATGRSDPAALGLGPTVNVYG